MHKAKRIIAICLVLCMLLSVLPVSALAVNISTKPENGTTVGQPFAPGTGGSTNFRIPGIVTLNDGTLIAACDARWNHSGDGAGLDTIVSVSTDNGANWEYTYANYLGDNGDTYNNLSTCFIDPGIGTDGEKAYLIADLWPAGIALNTSRYSPVAGETGYDANGNLALRDASKDTVAIGSNGYNTMAANADYDYYLDLETLTLHKNDGTPVEGYTVDAYFNIKGEGVDTNLFFSDSPFQPYPTDYLYMTTSTDGLTWSEPQLLNLKEASEQTLLIGPGNGTYDAVNDRMVFTGYEHSSGYERASLIWMDGEGNWYRSEDATVNSWSSEATSVVLDDGTVRTFYRDGYTTLRYTDYVFDESINNYVRADYEVDTGVAIDSGCQLTSILHSQQVDGKDLVLVAGPTSSRRINGYIYAFLVDEDNSMELAYAYNVTPDFYAYSCLTELKDGRIGLLYESAGSALTFVTYDFDEIITRDNDPRLTVKKVELMEGETAAFTDNSGYYGNADTSELNTAVAEVSLSGAETTTNAAKVLSSGANIDLDSCQYTFTLGEDGYYEVSATTLDGETVYLNHFSTTNNNIPNIATPGKIAILESAHENMFKLQAQVIEGAGSGAARGLHFHMEYDAPYWNRCGNDSSAKCHEYLFRKAAAGETSSEQIPGYVLITSLDEIVDGGKYLIAAKNDAGNWFVLNPSTSSDKFGHVAQIMGSTTVGYTELTFTGIGKGYTEVVIGSTLYKVTVYGPTKINLKVGESVTVTDETGYYVGADVSALDTSVATVEVTGEITGYEKVLSENVTAIESGKSYVLYNKAARKLMSNEWADASVGGGGTDGLSLGSTTSNFEDNDCWTITATEGGYHVQDLDGKYLSIAHGKAQVKDETVVINLDFDGTDWTIGENGQYANDFGGAHSAVAGWRDIDDNNSQWELYEVSEVAIGTTTITFTGVGAGETSVQIGDELYAITVVEADIHEHVFGDWTVTKEATCTEDGSRERVCECGEKETEVIAAQGHVYTDDLDADCDVCGEIRDIIDPNDPWGKSKWVKIHVDTETIDNEKEGKFEYAWDNDTITRWHSNWKGAHDVLDGTNTISGSIDFTREYKINQFSFLPRQDDTGWANGDGVVTMASLYKGSLNDDGTYTWEPLAEHVEFEHNQQWKTFTFEEQEIRYIKFVAERSVYDGWVVVAEFDLGYEKAEHEHVFGEWTVTTAPTCTEKGIETRTCECGESETREIDALGHSYEAVVTDPTCTENGYTTYTCECGDSYTADETDALGHNEVIIPGTEATFDHAGQTGGKQCDRCKEILVAQETIPALNYNEGIVPIDVLTTTAGDYYASDIPANVLDDNFGTMWHTDWYGSSRDGHWIQFELSDWYAVDGLRYKPRTDLNRLGEPQLNGTITQYKIQVSNDGVTFEDVATGNWDANQNWKTVEFDAQTAKYIRLVAVDACTDNDSVFASAAEIRLVGAKTEAPPHEHSYTAVVTAPTCTEGGYTTYTCECGDTYTADETAALGHTEEVIPGKEATCTETGLTEGKKCSVCQEILVAQEEIPALGHNYENGKCDRCDNILTSKFEDVPAGEFYFDPVEWAVEKGVTTGATATTFDPNGNCQRASVVTFLWRAAGSPEPTTKENPFTDVNEGDFFYKAVLWAVEKEITNGMTTTSFGPYVECNRAQVVTFLWRSQGQPGSQAKVDFTDVKAGEFYTTAVAWAVENEITNGMGGNIFGVDEICNRAQVVTFLYRTMNK